MLDIKRFNGDLKIAKNEPDWNVIIGNFNSNDFKLFNILGKDGYLLNDIKVKVKRKIIDPEDFNSFAKEVQSSLMYQYWSRTEYEIILTSWPTFMSIENFEKTKAEYEAAKKIHEENGWKGPYHIHPYLDTEEKIDVYEQVMMNWIPFINYLWNNRYTFLTKKKTKKEPVVNIPTVWVEDKLSDMEGVTTSTESTGYQVIDMSEIYKERQNNGE